jgi:hypothetical protein
VVNRLVWMLANLVMVSACVLTHAAEYPTVPPATDPRVTQAAIRIPGGDWLVYEGDVTFVNSPIVVRRVGPNMTGTKWTATLAPGEVRTRVSRGLPRNVQVHVGRGQNAGTVEFKILAATAAFRETLDLETGKSLAREDSSN